MSRLVLRPPRVADEAAVRRAQHEMAVEGFDFALFDDPGEPFEAYVERQANWARGLDLPAGRVSATFLLAEIDGEVVGRTSIRHRLNDFLEREGGHIGYGVVGVHRRRGYATEILRQSLIVARSLGIGDALLFCDDDNVASARVIEACGGVLERRPRSSTSRLIRRYTIPLRP